MQKLTLFLLLVTSMFFSCQKDDKEFNCDSLKAGLAATDVNRVKEAIDDYIASMPNRDDNEENIQEICQRITSNCEVTAELLCFDCVQTLPSTAIRSRS